MSGGGWRYTQTHRRAYLERGRIRLHLRKQGGLHLFEEHYETGGVACCFCGKAPTPSQSFTKCAFPDSGHHYCDRPSCGQLARHLGICCCAHCVQQEDLVDYAEHWDAGRQLCLQCLEYRDDMHPLCVR